MGQGGAFSKQNKQEWGVFGTKTVLLLVCNHSREVQMTKTLAAMLDGHQHGGDDVSYSY